MGAPDAGACCGKKHPCPDCRACQFCSDRRCDLCQGWLRRDGESDTAPGGDRAGDSGKDNNAKTGK